MLLGLEESEKLLSLDSDPHSFFLGPLSYGSVATYQCPEGFVFETPGVAARTDEGSPVLVRD